MGWQDSARGRAFGSGVSTGDVEMLFLGWVLFYLTGRHKFSDPLDFPSVTHFTSHITFKKLGTEAVTFSKMWLKHTSVSKWDSGNIQC